MPTESAKTDMRVPHPLLSALGRALEATLNRAIALDPETQARLAALNGRAVTLVFKNTPLAMRIAVTDQQLTIGPAFGGASELRVMATPGSLLTMALNHSGEAIFPAAKVEIAGDAELARRLEQIASRFAPDIDEAFTRVFGDVLGFQVAKGFRGIFTWARESAQTLALDTVDYFTEESRDIITLREASNFFEEVNAIRERTEHIATRVRQLTLLAQGGNRDLA